MSQNANLHIQIAGRVLASLQEHRSNTMDLRALRMLAQSDEERLMSEEQLAAIVVKREQDLLTEKPKSA